MSEAMRDAYGKALVKYGRDDLRVVVLDADVSGSTRSGYFAKAYPERFYNVGIAEANMVSVAAGLASVGKIPVVNTFAVFLGTIGLLSARTYGSYSGLPVKYVGAYGGVSDAFDGPTHHALEDIAAMRTLPNMTVLVPSDAAQADWAVKYMLTAPGPVYLRVARNPVGDIYPMGTEFEPGKGRILREGNDVTVVACGTMVNEALKAADILKGDGISAGVVDMPFIKPVDEALLIACAKKTQAIVTAEEHNVIGGLGSAVAEVIAKNGCGVPVAFCGVADTHCECGPCGELMAKYEIDADGIVKKVKAVLLIKDGRQ